MKSSWCKQCTFLLCSGSGGREREYKTLQLASQKSEDQARSGSKACMCGSPRDQQIVFLISSFWPLWLSAQAAITEYHQLEVYFSQLWNLGSPWSRYQQIPCLSRAYFLVHRLLFSHCVIVLCKCLFYKNINPTYEGFELTTFQRPHLPVPSL